mmetsp:Transcript_60654/g.110628  ORF Transcript_60654/g.110628 Transcript_60654/m.110628 type:complete len:310 (-) Transcript_60654:19-948(-)
MPCTCTRRMLLRVCCLLLLACAAGSEKPRHKAESILEMSEAPDAAKEAAQELQRPQGHLQEERPSPHLMRSEAPMSVRQRETNVSIKKSLLEKDSKTETDTMTFRSFEDIWRTEMKDGILARANATTKNWDEWHVGQCANKKGRPLWRTRRDVGSPGDLMGCQSLCSYVENVLGCEFDENTGTCYSFTEAIKGVAGSSGQCCVKLPSDCEFGPWKEAGDCSATCGPGKVNMERKIRLPAALGGICQGDTTDVEDCEVEECPTEPPPPALDTEIEAGARHGAQLHGCLLASIVGLSFSALLPRSVELHSN